jgi:hypothetical protein
VRYEALHRPDPPYTRDFEDVVAFLAQHMAETPVGPGAHADRVGLGRGTIVTRVVADHLVAIPLTRPPCRAHLS